MSKEVDKIWPTSVQGKEIQPQKTSPDPKNFQSMMQKTSSSSTNPEAISPMELAQKSLEPGGASLQEIQKNVASSEQHLGQIQKKLRDNPKLRWKRQQEALLEKKMQRANKHMQKMNDKLGLPKEAEQRLHGQGPLEKFLGYVTSGQTKLLQAKDRLETMAKSRQELNPANLLAIQIQAAQAQQNLEYSSILLSKVIETFKQMLNIQL